MASRKPQNSMLRLAPLSVSATSFLLLLSLLSSLLPTANAVTEEYDSENDAWREAGFTPTTQLCGTVPLPTQRMAVGDKILLDASKVCDYQGILLEESSDPEFPINIGWLQSGHWFGYDLALSTAGVYDMNIRTASVTGDGAFELKNADSGEIYKVFEGVANTGGWQTWEVMSAGFIALPRGSTTLRIESLQGGWNIIWIELTLLEIFDGLDETFDEEVRGDDFNVGDGLANLIQLPDGKSYLDNIFDGDEIFFDLEVEETGKYTMYVQVANPTGIGWFVIYDYETGHLYGLSSRPLPQTAAWDDWKTELVSDIFLEADRLYKMSLFVVEGGWNLATVGLDFEMAAPVIEPFISVVPARDFLKATGVMVDPINKNVGSIEDGAVLEYTLNNVPLTSTYSVRLWIASPLGFGSINIRHGDTDEILASMPEIPSTGDDWLGWVPMNFPGIPGVAGEPIPIKVEIIQGGFNMMVLSYLSEEYLGLI